MIEAMLVSFFGGIIVLSYIACAFFASGTASSKGRSELGWFVLGLVFGPIGLIAVGFAENIETSRRIQALQGYKNDYFVKCKSCAEIIGVSAKACHFCGHIKEVKAAASAKAQEVQPPTTEVA